MAFQVSPGVNIREIDLSTVVPAVSASVGAVAGVFGWGPAEERVLVSSENSLVKIFGKPTADNYETFYTAANFLAYGNALYVARAIDAAAKNAQALKSGGTATAIQIKNLADYEDGITADANAYFYARYAGAIGNSLKISVCDSSDAYSSAVDLTITSGDGIAYGTNYETSVAAATTVSTSRSTATATALTTTTSFDTTFDTTTSYSTSKPTSNVSSGTASLTLVPNSLVANIVATSATTSGALGIAEYVASQFQVGDLLLVEGTTQYMKIASIATTATAGATGTATLAVTFESKYTGAANAVANSSNGLTRFWEFYNVVDAAPGQSAYVAAYGNTSAQDELHVVVIDQDGLFTGSKNAVLEVFENVSRATDAKGENGKSIYYKDVIANDSQYIYWANAIQGAPVAAAAAVVSSSNELPFTASFVGGVNSGSESSIALGSVATAYDLFNDADTVDISLVLTGRANSGVANYVIDNITESRKDCVAFVSPTRSASADAVVAFRNLLSSTSYAVMDSGYKYQYDRYNDVYRYIPLNGDIAGLCARTDSVADPWVSPAGFSRGVIKNVTRLNWNPNKAERDVLYKNGVNPVVTFPGQGTVLYGDKTLLNKASAFSEIGIRRLFIVLEKAIATASKFALFEFNDEFTRAQFRNLVEPYLREVQGRRGVTDFAVVCDSTNNTAEVRDRREFVGDIYIKPNHSINYIQLNFVAVRSGVDFNEIVKGV